MKQWNNNKLVPAMKLNQFAWLKANSNFRRRVSLDIRMEILDGFLGAFHSLIQ